MLRTRRNFLPIDAETNQGTEMATMQVKSIMDRLVPPQPSGMETIEPVPQPSPMAAGFDDVSKESQYTATTTPFDESKGVAGRVGAITDSGSSLMQRAAARGTEQAQARGLRNSTMAVQAGQAAMLDAALPIATSDANLYQNQQLANQQAINTAAATNEQVRASIRTEGLKQGEQARQFGQTIGLERSKLGETARQFDVGIGLDREKLAQQAAQFSDNLNLQRDQLSTQRDEIARKYGIAADQLNLQRDQLSQQDQQFLRELDLKRQQLDRQDEQFKAELSAKQAIANLDSQTRLQLGQLEANFKTDIQSSQNVANAWGTMLQEVGKIQNNPDIEAGAKQTLIQNTINAFQSFANFWKKATGGEVDVSDLLKFGVSGGGQSGTGSTPSQPTSTATPIGANVPAWMDPANRP